MADRKKITRRRIADSPQVVGGQEDSLQSPPEGIVGRAAEWSREAGEFTAEDLIQGMGVSADDAVTITITLYEIKLIELVAESPDGDALHTRYRARLTTSPILGDAPAVEMEKDQGWVYEEIALDKTCGPPVARTAFEAFLAIGQKARAQREDLRAELQAELDEFWEHVDAGDGHLGSLEANQDFARALNSILDELGLRLKDPKTGLPATLRAYRAGRGSETGYFAFKVVGSSSRGSHRRLPQLTLMDRPEYSLRGRRRPK